MTVRPPPPSQIKGFCMKRMSLMKLILILMQCFTVQTFVIWKYQQETIANFQFKQFKDGSDSNT